MAYACRPTLCLTFLLLLSFRVFGMNGILCGPCNKVMCPQQQCSGLLSDDRVADACNCCKLCPINEGEQCGDYRSMRVHCHPHLECVPHSYNSTIGVCRRRVTAQFDACLAQPCRSGQQCVSQGSKVICKDLACSPQRIYKGCDVDSLSGSCKCRERQDCVSPFKYATERDCINRTKTAACSNIKCMNFSSSCPSDSFKNQHSTGLEQSNCCEKRRTCYCSQTCKKPPLHCGYAGIKRVRMRRGNGISPSLCCDVYDCVRDTRPSCPRHLPCPSAITCPPDSERVTETRSSKSCCPDPGYCVCKPCEVKCPEKFFPRLILKGSGTPGGCCPTYECQKDELHCVHSDGTWHHGSTSWRPTLCRHCTCMQGLETCSDIRCKRQQSCVNSYIPDGQCCPVCLNGTLNSKSSGLDCKTDGGQTFRSGTTWSVSDCTYCSCNNGVTTCRMSQCDYVPCANQEKVPGECCPACVVHPGRRSCTDDPLLGQVTRRHNEHWYWNDTCIECVCKDAKVFCSAHEVHVCPLIRCPNPFRLEDSCCYQCPEVETLLEDKCTYNGKTYNIGDKWQGKSKCRHCECLENGRKDCSPKCPVLNCTDGNPQVVKGECCLVCPEEIARRGLKACSQADCPLTLPVCLEDEYPSPKAGECCLVCKKRKDSCKKKTCPPGHSCMLINNEDHCVLDVVPSTVSSIATTSTFHITERVLSQYYVYLVIEMPYSEFSTPFESYFATDFSLFLSPGFHNVRVIVLQHEEFLYGRLDKVRHQAIDRFSREINSMTLVQILVEDEEGHYIAATQVIAVIERNSNKFSENKQEFMVIRWFTEQQLLEEDVYSVMFTEASVPITQLRQHFIWTEHKPAEKNKNDFGVIAVYVVAAVIGSICIAFLTVFFLVGIHSKLKNRKGMKQHNNTTKQTHQHTEEAGVAYFESQDVLAKRLASMSRTRDSLTHTQASKTLSVTAEETTLPSVMDSVMDCNPTVSPAADADGENEFVCGQPDNISRSHSIASEDSVLEKISSDKSRSPSPPHVLTLTERETVGEASESHSTCSSKSNVSTTAAHSSVSEKVHTFV